MNVPGYKIEKQIGQGGMASVYLAIQESLDRPVALKVLSPNFSESPEFSKRFLNEGKILASLRHTNIITIHDIGIEGGMHYISMEFVEGKDLKHRLREGIKPSVALSYIETLADCLQIAHSRNIVHRDVKPANVMFREDGTLLLTDFGIAKMIDGPTELTVTGSTLGSPHYLSPEQAQAKPLDGRADIYSLGIMLYEMLVGKKPYHGDSDINTVLKHITDPLPTLPAHLQAFQPLLDKMIAKSADDRFADTAELVGAIRAFKDSEQVTLDKLDALFDNPASLFDAETKQFDAPQAVPAVTSAEPAGTTESGDTKTQPLVAEDDDTPVVAPTADGDTSATIAEIFQQVDPDADTEVRPSPASAPEVKKRRPILLLSTLAVLTVLVTAGVGIWVTGIPDSPWLSQNGGASTDSADQSPGVGQQQPTAEQSPAPRVTSADPPTSAQPLPPVRDLSTGAVESGAQPSGIQGESAAASTAGSTATTGSQQQASISPQPSAPPVATMTAEERAAAERREKEISTLLRLAERALEDVRLTKPDGDNAYSYYQRVLELDAKNKAAKAGLVRIADKYGELAKARMDRRDFSKADEYIDRGLAIDPWNAGLIALKSDLASTSRSVQKRRYKEDTPEELYNRVKKFFE